MKKIKLIDICDFQGGSQPPKKEWSYEKKDNFIRMLQIRDFTQGNSKIEYVKITKSTKICEEDDVLIARYGASIGKILTGLKGAYNVAIMKTIPNLDKIDKRYLYYFLKSDYFQNHIKNIGGRAAQAGFNKEELSEIEINEIDLIEQKYIVKKLDKIQNLIDINKKQISLLNELKRVKFIEIFGNPILNEKNWKISYLKELGILKNGMNFSSSDNGYTIKFLGVGDFKNGYLIDSINFLQDINLCEKPSDEYLLKNRDILFVRSNGSKELVGRSLLVDNIDEEVTYSGFCIRYRNESKDVNSKFLINLFQNNEFTEFLKKDSRGANINNINQQMLSNLPIIIPQLQIQNYFLDIENKINEQKLNYEKNLEKLEELLNSLMNKYFN